MRQRTLLAVTREVSPTICACELTHFPRQPINLTLARSQHDAYEASLVRLGCLIHRLPAEPQLPDSVFVEDTCVVFDELAVITRPGASSRRPETSSVAAALGNHRDVRQITAPATMDGGDVLVHKNSIYVGLSARTNHDAVGQLSKFVEPWGYRVCAVHVRGCLHLKSAISLVAENTVLANRSWVNLTDFRNVSVIDVDESEPESANALLVNGVVLYPNAYPQTRMRLEQGGVEVWPVEFSELKKAEGGVTCCSVIFRTAHATLPA